MTHRTAKLLVFAWWATVATMCVLLILDIVSVALGIGL